MKATAATIHARHVERSASHAVLRGVGIWGEAKNPTALLILGWIASWGLFLSLAVIALAGVSTAAGRQAAAVSEVRRPSDSAMVPDPGMLFKTENDVYYAP
jgi:hypothetical protein